MKNNKVSYYIILFIVLCSLLFFSINMNLLAKEVIVIKWAHIQAPGHTCYEAPLFFQQKIEELSEGKIVCEVYPSSQLGGNRDLIESAKIGNIQITVPNTATMSLTCSEFALYSLPFLFDDSSHIVRFANGTYGTKLAVMYEQKTGLRILGYFSDPARGLENSEGSVYLPEQLVGKKIRIMQSEMYRDMFEAVGALPTPIAFAEVYTSLATNLIWGAEIPANSYMTKKLYEVAPYYSRLGHTNSVLPILINANFFDNLSTDEQKLISKAIEETTKYQHEIDRTAIDEAIAFLANNNVKINYVNKDAFKEKMTPVYDKWKKKIGTDFVEGFISYADETK
jgi:tripartite ATP-independent transporter DctP family solute receptor